MLSLFLLSSGLAQSVLKEAKAVAKPVDTVILFSALNTEK